MVKPRLVMSFKPPYLAQITQSAPLFVLVRTSKIGLSFFHLRSTEISPIFSYTYSQMDYLS